jgi:nucleolar protein 9
MKKRKQKEKADKITEDARSNKPDFSQKENSKRPKSAKSSAERGSSAKNTREGTDASASMMFLKGSVKRKSPGFLSDKPSLKKQKHHKLVSGRPDGKLFVRDSGTSAPFVKNAGKQKQSIAELADLAGKEKLTASEVRKLLKPEMSGKS